MYSKYLKTGIDNTMELVLMLNFLIKHEWETEQKYRPGRGKADLLYFCIKCQVPNLISSIFKEVIN